MLDQDEILQDSQAVIAVLPYITSRMVVVSFARMITMFKTLQVQGCAQSRGLGPRLPPRVVVSSDRRKIPRLELAVF